MKFKLLFTCVLLSSVVWAQNKITGKITDEANGEALIGASVLAKGTTVGTVTDVDGNFSFDVPAGATALVVSFVGYSPKEIAMVAGQNSYAVTLSGSNLLNDVVVVGYGTATKKELTGSVSKISGDQISGLPVAGLDAAMQGQAPGVMVTSNSGTPGGAISVRIRGVASINGTNQPLYVVDGVPVTTGSLSELGVGNQQTNALSDINPSDIESIEILKDAAAASIYGARSSNGVVLVTTKRGKSGKTKIDLNTSYGTQSVIKKLGVITGPQYETLVNESRANVGQSNIFTPADIPNAPTTNWQDQIFRDAGMSTTNLSLSGGNERTRYFASGGWLNQDGIVIGSNFQRATARLNVDNNITDNLKITLSSSFTQSSSARVNNDNNIYGVVSAAVLLGPHIPIYNADGTFAHDPNSSVENPVAAATLPDINYTTQRVIGNAALEWTIIPGLVAKTSFGADLNNFRDFRFYPTTVNAGAAIGGQATEAISRDYNLLNENTLAYKNNFGKFKFDVLGGISFQNDKLSYLYANGQKFPGNTIRTLDAAAVKADIQSLATQYGINSYFGRASATWDGKYTLLYSFRFDGSSRFGADNKWGFFPSVSGSWNVSDEGFFRPIKSWFSTLHLKGGVGTRGSADIANFASRGLIQAVGSNGVAAAYNQSPGLAPSQLANTALSWEQRVDYSGGIEMGFLKDRLTLSVEPYKSYVTRLLLNQPVVATTGFTSIAANAAEMESNGIDFGFIAKSVQTNTFSWTTSINVATYKNEVTKYPTPSAAGFGSWLQGRKYDANGNLVENGYSLSSFRGYVVEGIFQNQAEIDAANAAAKAANGATALYQVSATKPGDIKFKDINGDGRITAADQQIIGKGLPDLLYSVTNTFTYNSPNLGAFDLSVFFQGQSGVNVLNYTRDFSEGMNGVFGSTDGVLNRWTPDNANTDVPRAAYGDPNGNRRVSTRFVEDGSYVRLKNLTFGYTLPSNLTRRIGIQRLRAYFSAQNVWTKTNYKGYDPEVSTFAEGNTALGTGGAASTAFGTDFLTFPPAKTYTFGLNVSF